MADDVVKEDIPDVEEVKTSNRKVYLASFIALVIIALIADGEIAYSAVRSSPKAIPMDKPTASSVLLAEKELENGEDLEDVSEETTIQDIEFKNGKGFEVFTEETRTKVAVSTPQFFEDITHLASCKPVRMLKEGTSKSECWTLRDRKDGWGMRYLGVLSTIAFLNFRGGAYCHRGIDGRRDAHRVNMTRADIAMGFPRGTDCKKCKYRRGGIFKVSLYGDKFNVDTMLNECVRRQMRDRFERGIQKLGISTLPIGFIKGKINVVVHLRRGDILKKEEGKFHAYRRFVPIDACKKMMDRIRLKYGLGNVFFNVHSEGNSKDFKLLVDGYNDVKLQLLGPEKIVEIMHSFVEADVLIMGSSSISYVAAVLRNGTKASNNYYPRPWKLPFRPLKNWKAYDYIDIYDLYDQGKN